MDLENVVGRFEFLHRERDALVPDAQVFFVASLQPNELVATSIAHRLVAFAQVVGRFVYPDKLCNRVARQGFAIEQMFPAVNHHPKLCPPVADVIVSNDVVSEKFRDPGKRISEDQATNMPDVHRLGDVGRTEVDHDATRCVSERHAEPIVLQELRGLHRDRLRLERKIDETRAGDCRRCAPFPDLEVLNDLLCKRSRILAPLLGEDERGVGLVIAKTRIGRGHHFASRRQTGRGQRARPIYRLRATEMFPWRRSKVRRRSSAVIPIRLRTGRDLAITRHGPQVEKAQIASARSTPRCADRDDTEEATTTLTWPGAPRRPPEFLLSSRPGARLSRTERSFKNLAIDASVRRWV